MFLTMLLLTPDEKSPGSSAWRNRRTSSKAALLLAAPLLASELVPEGSPLKLIWAASGQQICHLPMSSHCGPMPLSSILQRCHRSLAMVQSSRHMLMHVAPKCCPTLQWEPRSASLSRRACCFYDILTTAPALLTKSAGLARGALDLCRVAL